ncbi:MAG TPA: 3-deoxy-manno-octulosonate cytidylyltransferase [Candidatus Acidoferrales bacterium]
MSPLTVLAVIPARYDSSRFPGKPLASICGKSMIQRVHERVARARLPNQLLVATDDLRIAQEVESFGGRAVMTKATHRSGSERVAEVAATRSCDLVVNIQGDEPLIKPEAIDLAIERLLQGKEFEVSTLVTRMRNMDEVQAPGVVKVVTDISGGAIYFSRSAIPYSHSGSGIFFKHIGLYVYRRAFLLQYPQLPRGRLEEEEGLEQLRILENGYRILAVETDWDAISVDSPEDLARVEEQLKGG